jgi:hypothetical protein
MKKNQMTAKRKKEIIKIRMVISQRWNTHSIERVYWFLRMIKKINKSLTQLPKKKKQLNIS